MSPLPNIAILLAIAIVAVLASPAHGAETVDVDVVLVAEIQDIGGWLTLHQEVLAAVTETSRVLVVALPARTGGNRSINLERPKFTASMGFGAGSSTVKVTIAGKVNRAAALRVVTPFQHAAFEAQTGAVSNQLSLSYGLSGVVGSLLELHISRP
jgi:hypothetical protein